jgi:hypothetical protein
VWRLGAADAAKLAGTPPPADFSDPYPTEGPASLMAANLLSESQEYTAEAALDRIVAISDFGQPRSRNDLPGTCSQPGADTGSRASEVIPARALF